jgi:hypothetical protein
MIKTSVFKGLLLGAMLALGSLAHASQVNLTWKAPVTTMSFGFNVYRTAQVSGSCPTFSTTAWTQIVGSLNSNTLAYSDTTIATGTTYCYAVTAYNTAQVGESGPSNIISVGTTVVSTTPPPPSSLLGTFVQ